MPKHPGGRPKEWTPERCQEVLDLMNKYIEDNQIPIMAEFCYMNDLPREYLYQLSEFSYTIRKMMMKKEANLERGGLDGSLNPGICAFSLKQLGWKDRPDVTDYSDVINGFREIMGAIVGDR